MCGWVTELARLIFEQMIQQAQATRRAQAARGATGGGEISLTVRGGLWAQVRCGADGGLELMLARKGVPPTEAEWRAVCELLPEAYRAAAAAAPFDLQQRQAWFLLASRQPIRAEEG